ncbi:M90 family metallopeptidase [Gallaecimonas mangrovi]|uniref:M90 family metallopeptidase n=1 Tax=Gallaecimonas mangrovi TaxID=2291597 RepID=UPI000E2011C2|nr:M90 family metallopeptidase [Gallaecimonas mangrovi]
MAIVTLVVLALLLIAWWLYGEQLKKRFYRRREKPLSETDRRQLATDMPLYLRLPAAQRQKLDGLMQAFLSRIDFIGCDGLTVTARMRHLVAAQACLLLLGRDEPAYPTVHSVYLFEGDFINKMPQHLPGGIVDMQGKHLAGESWGDGRVILSWQGCLRSAEHPFDGQNLVVHEFAHQLDQAKGFATGAPLQRSIPEAQQWQQVFSHAFRRHCEATFHGHRGLIDPYGATNPAEFFAVVSEVFFEQGQALYEHEPDMYQALEHFYGLNTRLWH